MVIFTVIIYYYSELIMRAQDNHTLFGDEQHIKRKKIYLHVTVRKDQINAEEDAFVGSILLTPTTTLSSLEKQILVCF